MELGELGIYLGIIFTRMFVYGEFFYTAILGNLEWNFFGIFLQVIFFKDLAITIFRFKWSYVFY